ncbi:MAG: dodecin family protein [Candidatus Nanopelagicales bacterium]|nr:dodecin family protein [Candidatus Nanopelagicales bacterium]
MANRTYGISEVVGTASEGVDQAIRNGIERAGKSVRHLDWFEVEGIRGYIKDDQVHHFQVTMKLGYRLEDPA